MKIQQIKVSEIKIDPSNPNRMSDRQLSGLAKSITKFGELQPVILDKDYIIIDGEHRYLAYKKLGKKEIPAIILELDENKKKLLRQAMNKIRGIHDETMDAEEMKKILSQIGMEEITSLLAISEQEIINLLQMLEPKKEKVEFEAILSKVQTTSFNFIVEEKKAEIIYQAMKLSGSENNNDALYLICDFFIKGVTNNAL